MFMGQEKQNPNIFSAANVMNRLKVIFEDGREEMFSDEHKSGVLYGITRLEQTPILPFLGIKLISDENGDILWPASEIAKRQTVSDS